MVSTQPLGVNHGFRTLRAGINAGSHQLALFGDGNDFANALSSITRSNGSCLVRPSRWTCRAFAFAGFGHWKKIRIRLLNFSDALRRLHRALQAFVIKAVRGSAGSLAIKRHAD